MADMDEMGSAEEDSIQEFISDDEESDSGASWREGGSDVSSSDDDEGGGDEGDSDEGIEPKGEEVDLTSPRGPRGCVRSTLYAEGSDEE